jgi:hypothetical protein
MTDDEGIGPDPQDAAARRERVVGAVLARISAAPPIAAPEDRARVDLGAWLAPALAAAVVVALVSGAALATASRSGGEPATVAESLGLPAPLARYLERGPVTPWEWFETFGERP